MDLVLLVFPNKRVLLSLPKETRISLGVAPFCMEIIMHLLLQYMEIRCSGLQLWKHARPFILLLERLLCMHGHQCCLFMERSFQIWFGACLSWREDAPLLRCCLFLLQLKSLTCLPIRCTFLNSVRLPRLQV
jgi:hypothetical protein